FGEFDRKAMIGAAMQTNDKTLHDVLGAQLQSLDLSQRLRI
ncbi:MAG: hypothetical protein ACI9G1_001079, partial [Pirellulaceae bacterium]